MFLSICNETSALLADDSHYSGGSVSECGRLNQPSWRLGALWYSYIILI